MRLDRAFAENVEYPTASDGRAARMPGSHLEWGVQCQVPGDVAELGPWHVWAVVRVQPRAETGPALQLGIYDTGSRGNRVALTKTIVDLPGGTWHTVDLGVHALTGECYLWVAPCKNPEAVEAVYVDRFFFAREGGLTP